MKLYKIFFYFLIYFFISIDFAVAQKTEINIALNSGVFNFRGTAVEDKTFLNINATTNNGYVNYPYGSKGAFSYGLSSNLKYVAPSDFILGADLGFELLRSKNNITAVFLTQPSGSSSTAATGSSILNQGFINLYPFAGYRLKSTNISFDFLLGLDLALRTSATEKNTAEVNSNTSYSFELEREFQNNFDYRTRAQIGLNYKHFGLYSGYSLGLTNYNKGSIGGINKTAKANFIRFGLSYRLK